MSSKNESGAQSAASRLAAYGDLRRPSQTCASSYIEAPEMARALKRLGLDTIPDLALLPRNLLTAADPDHLVYERDALDLQVLARQSGLELDTLTDAPQKTIHENDSTIILPAVILAAQIFENADKILSLIDFFSRIAGFVERRSNNAAEQVEVSQEVFVKKGVRITRSVFKGPPSALRDVPKVLKELNDEGA